MYLIDTDTLSAARGPDSAPHLRAWFAGRAEADLHLSAVTIGEIDRGIPRQDGRDPDFATDPRGWLDRTLQVFADRILPFGAVVVTGNARHFSATGVDAETPA